MIILSIVLGPLCMPSFKEPMRLDDMDETVLKEELNSSDHLVVMAVLETQ